jgi:hypothetical protein
MKNRVPTLVAAVLVATGAGGAVYLVVSTWGKKIEQPPPIPPPPSDVEAVLEREKKWLDAWLSVRQELDFNRWQPGDATLAQRTRTLIERMGRDASKRDALDLADWFLGQSRQAQDELARIGKDRDRAKNLVAWGSVVSSAASGSDSLKSAVERVNQARGEAEKVADYRGAFTLRFAVGPYAEVTQLRRDGKDVALKKRHTPLLVGSLEIGDYDGELSHPDLGKKRFQFKADRLREGRNYELKGLMRDGRFELVELP